MLSLNRLIRNLKEVLKEYFNQELKGKKNGKKLFPYLATYLAKNFPELVVDRAVYFKAIAAIFKLRLGNYCESTLDSASKDSILESKEIEIVSGEAKNFKQIVTSLGQSVARK